MDIRLDSRAALITGGSKGLGLATATRLAQSGADVAILARDPAGLEEARRTIAATARGRVFGAVCDVSRAEAIQSAFDQTMSAFGRVDILVNNAGESRSMPFEKVTDELWQADIDQKLMAAVRLGRLVWPQMKERGWGRIVNVLSTAAKAPRAANAPTAVTRAAGLSLTKILAHEGAPHGILVNAVLVGKIVSDQIVRRHRGSAGGQTLQEMIDEIGATVPLGRMGEAREFAQVVCFLASDAASYVTGVAIPVDGGLSPGI
jgi:NAD(P)-dependent dehydrogenase (short-subunit alcohol dehydrogenase family)